MTEPIISFKNFSFQYESQSEKTLDQINLNIFPGEKVMIAGASGSGKSTLGRCINGLIPQAYPGEMSGECLINGKPLNNSSIFDLSFDVGTVLQDPDSQFVGLTVAEDIAFSLENDQLPQVKMHEVTKKWSKKLDLTDLAQHSPQELSGGQKQRVAMAGVLIDESKILLFDEPLASLDPASGAASVKLIDQLAQKQSLTVIIIEHRIEEVLKGGIDRLVIMRNGKIVANDSPQKILKQSLLEKLGLREPLYLSALKRAGINLVECQNIDQVSRITEPQINQKLFEWNEHAKLSKKVKKGSTLLAINALSFGYTKEHPIIKDLSLEIKKGEMISLVGRNGAGKSTLSNLITGFLSPVSGSIKFKGQDLLNMSVKERAQYIGYILQDPNQMISKTMIYDEVASGLLLRGFLEDEIKQRVENILRICGLYEMRHWPISALSFGQKKRVTIASMLVLKPEMLILDEPTAGQDLKHYTEIMTFLEKLQQKNNLTIILITHDMHLMLEYTQRTIVLDHGKVLLDAEPAKVLTNDEIIKRAYLARTSLFDLAERYQLPSATDFVAKFIQAEREDRA
ncbi:ABC superfamily ATP binding cassette transporter, ABC protein [Liquorilactobacillus aquaticus DSM 21051]|uniref:ABC superfamily ATP binding cassette transporter, ABC protein n=1 Tax=Liquorilactobacillus aquaticus DSM 21051 TaxID=1423725 RepID=A0A0R2CUM5_9LACO|nr:ABC transporter ATP-binding protein [Liquorilactobacillus aquaticus]KRM95152.1 ABC superfamily ATP binding cassette transporter, ABC protein [Liquorilactobacillus aquaticus DSM 21051]